MSLPGREVLLDVEHSNTLIRESDLDWTIARYSMKLTNGPQTGHYRTGYLGKMSACISAAPMGQILSYRNWPKANSLKKRR